MEKNVLIISSTMRRGGNSEVLAAAFAKGAAEAGHRVETAQLRELPLHFCRGCYYCESAKKCVQNDGVNEILQKMLAADAIVFATPVYFYELSGQLKTFLDRTLPLYYSAFSHKDVYLLTTADDADDNTTDGTVAGLCNWLRCFEGLTLRGAVHGLGVGKLGTAEGSKAQQDAYAMGRGL